MIGLSVFILVCFALIGTASMIAGAVSAAEEGPAKTPDIERLNRRRRRKAFLREHLRSLACRLGFHDWVTREVIQGTTSVTSILGSVQSGVSALGFRQRCKCCPAQREVIDTGFAEKTVPVGTL